ncbi:hypothetical protein [Taibaiella koreensis]|uniref:hypothetical protein n=1 Tax=Taibaiella koreensis TaxID=1268548 RepID=UPI000E59E7E5|nr:hypothetical protein [Taibaiella koreensis]
MIWKQASKQASKLSGFAPDFESFDSDIYTDIEKMQNEEYSNTEMIWDLAGHSRQAVKWAMYIPQGALLFSTKTAWGRTLSGAGSKLSLSELKLTKSFSGVLTRIGWGLGAVNAGLIYHQYETGKIGKFQFVSEEVSNGLSQVPMLGWAWGVGWEGGRLITNSNFYKDNLRPYIWGGLDFITNRKTPLH